MQIPWKMEVKAMMRRKLFLWSGGYVRSCKYINSVISLMKLQAESEKGAVCTSKSQLLKYQEASDHT